MTGKETPAKDEAPRPPQAPSNTNKAAGKPATPPEEIGGRDGPEPTRYGDWEVKGICSDF